MHRIAAPLMGLTLLVAAGRPSAADGPLSEDEIVTKLLNQGVTIQRDETLPERPIVEVRLLGCAAREELVDLVALLPTIERLTLHHGVKDAGLKQAAGLERLTVLSMKGARVSSETYRHLAGLTKLRELNASGSTFDDAALIHLQNMTELRELDLSDTQVTDAGLAALKRFATLEALNLEQTDDPLTDAGVAHLKEIKSLKRLNLGGSDLTDAGLDQLTVLKQLEELTIEGTGVTAEGIAAFERARPGVKVTR